jgi:hypothetical protein
VRNSPVEDRRRVGWRVAQAGVRRQTTTLGSGGVDLTTRSSARGAVSRRRPAMRPSLRPLPERSRLPGPRTRRSHPNSPPKSRAGTGRDGGGAGRGARRHRHGRVGHGARRAAGGRSERGGRDCGRVGAGAKRAGAVGACPSEGPGPAPGARGLPGAGRTRTDGDDDRSGRALRRCPAWRPGRRGAVSRPTPGGRVRTGRAARPPGERLPARRAARPPGESLPAGRAIPPPDGRRTGAAA